MDCGYCRMEGDRRTRWKMFQCSCGAIHYFCEICYRDLLDKGAIVRRGQRGGGKKDFLKACPREVRVAEAMMREDRRVDWEVTNL